MASLFSLFSLLSLILWHSIHHVDAATPTAAFNATVAALVYGAPLLAFYKTVEQYSHLGAPNSFIHAKTFVNATSQIVVESNTDTLYSFLAIDLSSTSLMISLPNITADQFYLLSFFDAYGDNFATFGNLETPPVAGGEILLRVASEASVSPGQESSTTVNGVSYDGVVDFPGTFGILLIRWLVRDDNYDSIYAYQQATTVTTVAGPSSSSSVTLQDVLGFTLSDNQATDILKLTALIAPPNPPEVTSDEQVVNAELIAAGVKNNTYTPESGVDLKLANASANALAYASLLIPRTTTTLNNDWKMVNTSIIGNYKSAYGVRALLGSTAYLAVAAPAAIYPFYSQSTSTVEANQSYLYTFSGKPPLRDTGFWSVTMYNSSGFFINNPLNVYALGDRSNLTYSDGTAVYGNNSNADGEFQILIQPVDVTPPANWTNNWLPAPAGGGQFKALLRAYGPSGDLLDATYQYPVVTKQAAITNSSSSSGGGGGSSSGSSGGSNAAISKAQWQASSFLSMLGFIGAVISFSF